MGMVFFFLELEITTFKSFGWPIRPIHRSIPLKLFISESFHEFDDSGSTLLQQEKQKYTLYK